MITGEPLMTPLGAVVFGPCDANIPQVCLYLDAAGAVFVFNDQHGKQYNVCKACADYSFNMGFWRKPGESGTTGGSSAEFAEVIRELRAAKTDEDRIAVGQRNKEKRWSIAIPLSAGDCLERYWVAAVQFPRLGWVKVAFPTENEDAIPSTPTQVRVRAVSSADELAESGGADFVAIPAGS